MVKSPKVRKRKIFKAIKDDCDFEMNTYEMENGKTYIKLIHMTTGIFVTGIGSRSKILPELKKKLTNNIKDQQQAKVKKK